MMTASRNRRLFLSAALLCLLPFGEQSAQSSRQSSHSSPYLEAIPFQPERSTAPDLTFRLLRDIQLPGPLPGTGPALAGGEIVIEVAGGIMASGWSAEAAPRMIEPPAESPAETGIWSVAPDGSFRCGLLLTGKLVGQKRCPGCRRGWNKKWKLRVAGEGLPPPLVTHNRVYYGAFDNRVYCVKRKNGHRLWVTDLPSRISRPLRRWLHALTPGAAELELVILIPDNSTSIIALDADTGSRVATYDLPQNGGLLVGSPVVTDDGKIVVASQKYTAAEASLLVFELIEPAAKSVSAQLPESDQR
jgi:hypothetical protein